MGVFIMNYRVFLRIKPFCVTIQIKALEKCFDMVLFIMQYYAVFLKKSATIQMKAVEQYILLYKAVQKI